MKAIKNRIFTVLEGAEAKELCRLGFLGQILDFAPFSVMSFCP